MLENMETSHIVQFFNLFPLLDNNLQPILANLSVQFEKSDSLFEVDETMVLLNQ